VTSSIELKACCAHANRIKHEGHQLYLLFIIIIYTGRPEKKNVFYY